MEFPGVWAYLAVLDAGSFAAAAAAHDTSRTRLGRLVTALETTVGHTLLERSEAGVTATPAGRAFARLGREVLESHNDALAYARDAAAGAAALRIYAHSDHAAVAYEQVLPRLLQALPGRTLDLRLVEAPGTRRDAGALAIIPRAKLKTGRAGAVPLDVSGAGLAASPEYVRRRALPAGFADLSDHALVGAAPSVDWALKSGGVATIRPTLQVPGPAEVEPAVRAGLGIGFVGDRSGLVPVLAQEVGSDQPLALVGPDELLEAWSATTPS